jgi:hypothetical protein
MLLASGNALLPTLMADNSYWIQEIQQPITIVLMSDLPAVEVAALRIEPVQRCRMACALHTTW